MKVKYYCPFGAQSGYGRAAHDYAMSMIAAGIELQIVPLHDVDTDDLEERYQGLVPYAENEVHNPTHVIVHTIPQHAHEFVTTDLAPATGVKKIALTTWETSALPAIARDRLNEHFDLVIVPSQWNAEVFSASGVLKVTNVPHSFDPAWWYNPPFWNKDASPYRFYAISEWNERKNLHGLLKAYYAEFTSKDDVLLTIACRAFNRDNVEELKLAMNFPDVDLPRVEWVGGVLDERGEQTKKRLTERELLDLHQRSHCYVTLSRAEGWGLPAFEAALLGNHVIYSNNTGHQDFMLYTHKRQPVRTLETPVVDSQLVQPVEFAGLKIPANAKIDGFGFDGTQTWGEPDLEQARHAMRVAYFGREGLDGGGIADQPVRDKFIAKFSYKAAGERMKKVLENA